MELQENVDLHKKVGQACAWRLAEPLEAVLEASSVVYDPGAH